MKATIIGAGIGGLTLAIALRQKGIEVELFEATSEFKKVGAGIIIAINAMQVFKRLGLDEKISNTGNRLKRIELTNSNLQPLTTTNLEGFEKKYGLTSVAIHRAELHNILLGELEGVPFFLDKKLKKLEQKDGLIKLTFEDGTTHETNLLIGADGVHSAVRNAIFPAAQERLAKQICWRGIVDVELEPNYVQAAREAWGVEERFGIVPIGNNRVYWFACALYKNDARLEFKDKALTEVFSKFPNLVQEIINQTPQDKIITAELGDLIPIPTWYKGNICLIGDAAHATTPNMGQGANQAIESAWVLADCLAKESDLNKAFETYQKIRQPKATQITNQSWQFGKIAQVSNPFLAKVRNGVMRLTPDGLTTIQIGKLFELNY